MKNIWSIALSPSTATPNQRAQLVARQHPGRRQQLQHTDDERDPAPGAQVAEHVVRVGGEHVRVGDRGDAVDQVETADDHQQDRREQDQAVAFGLRARRCPGLAGLLPTSSFLPVSPEPPGHSSYPGPYSAHDPRASPRWHRLIGVKGPTRGPHHRSSRPRSPSDGDMALSPRTMPDGTAPEARWPRPASRPSPVITRGFRKGDHLAFMPSG